MGKNIEILIVCSVGGHLTQMLNLRNLYIDKNYHFVVNDRVDLDKIMVGKTSHVYHAERNIYQLINIFQAFTILSRKKPKIIISNGAAPGVVFQFIGKYFFNSKTIFIESLSRVKTPSLSAKLAYRFVDYFIVQWKEMKKVFPKAHYYGQSI